MSGLVGLGYFACALRKSNRNFIMLSPLSGPAKPDSRGGFHPTSILRAIFFDHISFIAPLTAPLSSHCYSISALGYWFSFCSVNLDLDQANLGQLTLTIIHIKAIWTAKFSSWLSKLTLSMESSTWHSDLKYIHDSENLWIIKVNHIPH